MVGDNTPAILNASPNVRISNPDSSYEDYVNQANEKHAQTWDFRGNNSNLKDDQGNYYIDPKGMQSIKKASEQFKSMRSYTKWFNTIPLLGVGAVGANKYFTSNENRD